MSKKYPSAGIKVTVTKFHKAAKILAVGTTYSEAEILLIGTGAGKVSQAGGMDTPIRVDSRAEVYLVFEVESKVILPNGSAAKFQPVGVSFFSQDGSIGLDDFPTRTVSTDPFKRMLLSVFDANVHSLAYKFNLIIQEETTGELGVIDPQVNNG